MSFTELFIFRHGETDWNRQRRFQGHTDIPLNETGLAQAAELAPLVHACDPQIILCSDLVRAKATADVVNERLGLEMIVSKELRECLLGDPEGMLRDKLFETYGEASWLQWISMKPEDRDFCFPNGETKTQHLQRMKNYLEQYCLANPHHSRVGVSTHGGSLLRLMHHCEGSPNEPIAIPNCVLYKARFEHASRKWIYGGRVESAIQNSSQGPFG